MDGRTEGRTDKPKAICPFNFSKVGGIKNVDAIHLEAAKIVSGGTKLSDDDSFNSDGSHFRATATQFRATANHFRATEANINRLRFTKHFTG